MTTEEKQEIINAVLSAIRTNSKTITQLTPVTEMSDDDYIELSGGRRVSYYRLYEVLLAAVEAVVQGNIDAMYNAISQLSQSVVHYSDVGESVPELSGINILALNQSPLVVFKSMGAAYDGVSRNITIGDGEAKYNGTGSSYQYNRRGTVGDYPILPNRVYFNSYTGRLYKWAGSSFEAIGGGMDGAIYDIIKSNVNLVAAKLDTLIGALAMLAFSGTVNKESLKVGSLSWVEPETHEPRIITPLDGSTLEFGNSTEDDEDIQIGLFIEGADLTEALTLSITEGSSRFRLGSGSSSIAATTANGGTTIYLYYNSSSSVANATGKLNIHSNEVDVTVNLHGTYSEQGGGDEPVQTPSISVSPSSLSFNAEVGQSAQQTFSVSGSNLTGSIQLSSSNNLFEVSPNSLSPTNGSVDATVTVTYRPNAAGNHSGTITASNSGAISKTVSLSGTATAAASTVNVVYKLLNISAPSTATQDQVWGYYKETANKSDNFSKPLSAINNATLRGDLTVKSGGVVLYKQEGSNNNSGITFSNGELSITSTVLNSLTDDLIIEATAYTRTVTITASESGVTATIGGTTITCSTSNGDGTYSGSASGITSISSLSFASGVKTKITSIDFGGAQFTGTTLASMFSGFTALTQVKGLVVTGSVTSLASMFSGCSALTVFDTIGWDTSNVTTIEKLAFDCSALTKVDLGSKNMTKLVSAGSSDSTGAFGGSLTSGAGCTSLVNLDVSYWNAPVLVSLRAFLFKASALTSFDASTWNAPNVETIWGMFASCSGLTDVDISGISTANANADSAFSLGHLFDNCTHLLNLTIGLFDTSNISSIESVLYLAGSSSSNQNKITLYCKSSIVPSINTTPDSNNNFSLVWFGNATLHTNFKYKISEVHVPSGKATDYYNAWAHVDLGGGNYANYIGLTEDKFIDDL